MDADDYSETQWRALQPKQAWQRAWTLRDDDGVQMYAMNVDSALVE